jgi:uncharacterized membrane protein YfcA
MPELSPEIWLIAIMVTLFAGFVKGVVGFALPMVMISGMASIFAPDVALAALILPAVATNLLQAFRNGWRAAVEAMKDHWRFIVVLWMVLAFSAQLITVLPEYAMFLILGVPVTIFSFLQLMGWRLRFRPEARRRVEVVIGAFAGFVGGLSGVWGPPTVAYLTALDIEKREHVRVQGVVYGSGAVMLMGSHIQSGVLTAGTAQLSAAMLAPALVGLFIGQLLQDRIDQSLFRRLTLIVLVVAGLNLVRRGLMG